MGFEAVWSFPLLQSALLIGAVLLIDSIWEWPPKFHPLVFFRYLATQMAKRVNRAEKSSAQQNKIAGSLAPLVIIAPLLVIIHIALSLVHNSWFFAALILWIALSFHSDFKRFKRAKRTIEAEQKHLTKETLQHLVQRDTQQLSALGTGKAAMESIVLRFYYQVAVTAFWFFVAGPAVALGVRLLYECQQVWPTRETRFRYFGAPVRSIYAWLAALPVLISSLFIGLFYRPVQVIPTWFTQLVGHNRNRILAISAAGINAELGGPVMVAGKKIRLPRFNRQHPTKIGHLAITQQYITGCKAILAVNYLLIATIIFGVI
ncbi:regulatory signaling modulator protein AmpE [Alteromonas sp. ASW11-36]|uniref:Regulatory signaling modulator protein AmpE n=1 Tax=Alteromonas arenosi TaxID=3055817 RepID=A0ABT7T031_9ALTE|nr:regulatory signaling modulator protein AmpE [Alteromonas sp. ASW11-36]MDM7861801.1 regulatory signaling modulator protein AmpE [Alteromonas sp. ASW11-36]